MSSADSKKNVISRKFWWGSKDGHRKPNCVSSEAMTQTKSNGGLGSAL